MDSVMTSKPYLGKIRSSKLFILTVINLAIFTDAYFYALIIPVLPFALHDRVQIPEDDVQRWIGFLLGAYGAGLLIGSPIAGWFADRGNSRRGPYLWGLVALAGSTVAFSLGRTKSVLVLGRLIQGASSASVHAVGMAILADTVGQEGAGPAMGFSGMCIALGVLVGPVVGGMLYHSYGYLAVFVSAYALVALDFLLRIIMILPAPKRTSPRADATYGTFPDGPINGHIPVDVNQGTISPSLPPPAYSTTPLLPSTLKQVPRTYRHPMLTLLTNSRMLAAILADFVESIVLTGLETILPLRTKHLFNYNSAQVALVFLTLIIGTFLAPLIGLVSDKVGAKIMVSTGFLALAPLVTLLRLVDHDTEAQLALLCALLLLIGIALNMLATPAFTEAMYVVADQEAAGAFGPQGAYAQAFSLMTVAYAAGSLVGPFVCGFLVERLGWNALTLAGGILCGLCALPCLYATGGKRLHQQAVVVVDGV